MKTKIIFLLLLFVCFACGTNNKPVSDVEKEEIKGQLKKIIDKFNKDLETLSFVDALAICDTTIDYTYIGNGEIIDYKTMAEDVKSGSTPINNQKITVLDEKFVFLDKSTVIYIGKSKCLMTMKSGNAVLQEPLVLQLIFTKNNNQWKIINMHESGKEYSVINKENAGQLNQIELNKQFVGKWKFDDANDTTGIIDFKQSGTCIEMNQKVFFKGKNIENDKMLFAYDKNLDIYNAYFLRNGEEMSFWAQWFISGSKYYFIPFRDLANPENAKFRFEGEFLSPDKFVETFIKNGKVAGKSTYTRIK